MCRRVGELIQRRDRVRLLRRAVITRSRAFVFLFSCALAACTSSVGGSGSDPGSGSDQTGSDTGSGSGSDPTDPDANVQPTYPTQHPRILLSNTARRAALVTSLQA